MCRIRIPAWAEKLLAEQRCPFCERPYTVDDVCASGNQRKEGKVYYFYQVECAKCKNPAQSLVKSRPCDSAQLAVYLMEFVKEKLDGLDDGDDEQVQPPPPAALDKDLITDDEVRRAHELLKTCPDHITFLHEIGMSAKDIKKYARPRK
jgi:hypothetical protein